MAARGRRASWRLHGSPITYEGSAGGSFAPLIPNPADPSIGVRILRRREKYKKFNALNAPQNQDVCARYCDGVIPVSRLKAVLKVDLELKPDS